MRIREYIILSFRMLSWCIKTNYSKNIQKIRKGEKKNYKSIWTSAFIFTQAQFEIQWNEHSPENARNYSISKNVGGILNKSAIEILNWFAIFPSFTIPLISPPCQDAKTALNEYKHQPWLWGGKNMRKLGFWRGK